MAFKHVALVLAVLALTVDIIGFSTPHWMSFNGGNSTQGLFQACFIGDCVSFGFAESWSRLLFWAQISNITALVSGIVGLVIIIGYLKTGNTKETFSAAFGPAACNIVGIGLYVGRIYNSDFLSPSYLSWSFYMTVAGTTLYVLEGVLVLVSWCRDS